MTSLDQIQDLQSIISLQQEVTTSHLELYELMALICQRTQDITHAAGAVVELVENEDMVYKAVSGSLKSTLGVKLKKNSSLSGMSVQLGEVLYCQDSETDPRVDREACRKVGARSMICVPLSHMKNVGVLKIVSPDANRFSEREISILRIIAAHLSALISQANEAYEKEQVHQHLVDSEKKMRTIFDSSSDAIVIAKDGICLEVNTAFTRIFGYTAEEFVGRSIYELIRPEFREPATTFAKSRYEEIYETVCVTKDGSRIEVEGSRKSLNYKNEDIKIITIRDVTERRKAQRALIETMEAKSFFIANMSHEVRTPLNGILGMAALIEDTELTQEQKKYINILKGSADNLLTIVNDILDFSKIEANKLELEDIAFPLLSVVEDVRQILSFGASKKGLVINSECDPRLPVYVSGDPTRIRQVLMNLLTNAIKFTERGEIHVRVEKVDQIIRFSVMDTGIGISKESMQKMFLPFTQADVSTTRKFGGTGLGLSICKQLVEMMGGHIGVESEVGIGSLFWFELPLPEATVSEQVVLPKTSPVPAKKLRILIAEDNDVNAMIAKVMLEKVGHEVKVAINGRKAIEALELGTFDVILMDCQMPEMDGFEATRTIRSSLLPWNNIPIIAMTANAMRGDRERCLEAGMNNYISKPIKREDLIKILSTSIS